MIRNLNDNNKIISNNEILCTNIFSQARGLMFRRKNNLIMDFKKEKRISLHMFFVFYPIDVIILDKNQKVVDIKKNFKPFTFWNSKKKGKYIIELGVEKNKQNISLGDYFKFK